MIGSALAAAASREGGAQTHVAAELRRLHATQRGPFLVTAIRVQWADADGDGINDDVDLCPSDSTNTDTDGDGACDITDLDDDGDGINDDEDAFPLNSAYSGGELWADVPSEDIDTLNVCWEGKWQGAEGGKWVVGNNTRGLTASEKLVMPGDPGFLAKGDPASANQKDQREAVNCMLNWVSGCKGKYRDWDGNRECVRDGKGCENQKCDRSVDVE